MSYIDKLFKEQEEYLNNIKNKNYIFGNSTEIEIRESTLLNLKEVDKYFKNIEKQFDIK